MQPQNMPLRHKDYLELKAIEKKQAQEKILCPLPSIIHHCGQPLILLGSERSPGEIYTTSLPEITLIFQSFFLHMFTFPQFVSPKTLNPPSFVLLPLYKLPFVKVLEASSSLTPLS